MPLEVVHPLHYLEGMTARQFQAWMKRNGLSWTTAAERLGVSRRMIGYYVDPDYEPGIPRTVALACWAIDQGAPEKV